MFYLISCGLSWHCHVNSDGGNSVIQSDRAVIKCHLQAGGSLEEIESIRRVHWAASRERERKGK